MQPAFLSYDFMVLEYTVIYRGVPQRIPFLPLTYACTCNSKGKFSYNWNNSSYITGGITVPGSGGGVILGGYLIKRFNLKVGGILRMCGACLFLCVLLGPSFLAVCPRTDIVGVSVPYEHES